LASSFSTARMRAFASVSMARAAFTWSAMRPCLMAMLAA
jgi:hypothetical protein